MALARCAECSKDISEKAKTCPHCGAPNAAQSFGAKMHRAVETAEELARVADQKLEAISNSPKTQSAIGIYNRAAKVASIAAAIVAVYGLVTLLMPPVKERFRSYAEYYSLPQCKQIQLAVRDPSDRFPKLHEVNTLACLGYVDAIQNRFGNQSVNSMDLFKNTPPEHRVAFEGIIEGCSQNSWGGDHEDFFYLCTKCEWGEEVNTYNDGARLFEKHRLTDSREIDRIKNNLRRCEDNFKSWGNYTNLDYYLAKLWLPPLPWPFPGYYAEY